MEALTGIKRAGADLIITYHAKDIAAGSLGGCRRGRAAHPRRCAARPPLAHWTVCTSHAENPRPTRSPATRTASRRRASSPGRSRAAATWPACTAAPRPSTGPTRASSAPPRRSRSSTRSPRSRTRSSSSPAATRCMRADIFDIAEYAIGKGLRTVMSPNGTLVTPEVARRMQGRRHRARQHLHRLPDRRGARRVPRRPRRLRRRRARHRATASTPASRCRSTRTITKLNVHYLPALLAARRATSAP